MRKQYDAELKNLADDLIRMAVLSEEAVEKAVKALVDKDKELAETVIRGDAQIDDFEKVIERQALKVIYKEQPVAEDLRKVSAALKMITDIERVGDQAADICGLVLKMAGQEYCKEIKHIPIMAGIAVKMVSDGVKAYANNDTALAEDIIRRDDLVDELFETVKRELIAILKASPESAEQVVYFMMIAKYIERIGDHAVNIAEWVIFNLTGVHKNTRIL